MLRPLLVTETVTLVFEDPADVPPLYTDEAKVSQILRNFISNALKFTERGEVRVSARARAGRPAASPSRSPTPASASRPRTRSRSSRSSARSSTPCSAR